MNLDTIRGCLTEMPCGPGINSEFTLELSILWSDKDGICFLLMLVGDRSESPQ